MKSKVLVALGIAVAVLAIGGVVLFFGGKDNSSAQVVAEVPKVEVAVQEPAEIIEQEDIFEWEDRAVDEGVQIKTIVSASKYSEPRVDSGVVETAIAVDTIFDVDAEAYQNGEFMGWLKVDNGYISMDEAEWIVVDAINYEEELQAMVETVVPEETVEVDEPSELVEVAESDEPVVQEPVVEEPAENIEPVVEEQVAENEPTPVPEQQPQEQVAQSTPEPAPAPSGGGNDFLSQLEQMGIEVSYTTFGDGNVEGIDITGDMLE